MEENNNQYYNQEQQYNASQQFNQQPYYSQPQPPQEEKASVGLAILSFIIPIVGLILYLTKKDSKPKTAKACGKCALACVIINIIITIIYSVIFGSVAKELVDDSLSTNANSSYSNEIDADGADPDNSVDGTTVGSYGCVVKGAELGKDWEGNDTVIITFDFTNNSNNPASFDVALDAKAYQEGIGLETDWSNDETDLLDVEIKPGVTKEVKKAYLLRDTSTDVEIEITEWLSFTDDKIVTTVKLG